MNSDVIISIPSDQDLVLLIQSSLSSLIITVSQRYFRQDFRSRDAQTWKWLFKNSSLSYKVYSESTSCAILK